MRNLIKTVLFAAIASQASAQVSVSKMPTRESSFPSNDYRYRTQENLNIKKIELKFPQDESAKRLEISKRNSVQSRPEKASLFAGGHDGNGGDICENKIKNITEDIRFWLISDRFVGIDLSFQTTEMQYKAGMLEAIKKTVGVSCTTDKIYIKQSEKTCKNFENSDGDSQIVCNFERFMKTNDRDSYKLVHHELAGIAGYETNNGNESSNYTISNQISEYLRSEVVVKLGVKINPTNPERSEKRLDQRDFYYFKGNVALELNRTRETGECSQSLFAGLYIETIVQLASSATTESVSPSSSLITFIAYGKGSETEYRATFLVSNNLEIIKPIKMELHKIEAMRVDRSGRTIFRKELAKTQSCE